MRKQYIFQWVLKENKTNNTCFKLKPEKVRDEWASLKGIL